MSDLVVLYCVGLPPEAYLHINIDESTHHMLILNTKNLSISVSLWIVDSIIIIIIVE